MSRVQLLEVNEGDGDQRLDRWFRRLFPQVQQGQIEKMCRKGDIRVDGGRVKSNMRVEVGQVVRIPPLPDTPAPAIIDKKISDADAKMIQSCVLYRDEHIIALKKPPGLPVQGAANSIAMWTVSPLRCGSAITKTRGLCIVWIRTPPGF